MHVVTQINGRRLGTDVFVLVSERVAALSSKGPSRDERAEVKTVKARECIVGTPVYLVDTRTKT